MERRLSAILAADIVGYSAQMERDESGTFARVTERRREVFEPEIARHQGRIFKLMGDGILAEFGSVVQAVECAMSIQLGLEERNAAMPDGEPILARIGINLGEVIVDGDDRYGEGVNIAARLEGLADPGGICVSEKVAREVEKKLAFGFQPMGPQKVKNITEPIEVFRVSRDPVPRRPAVAQKRRGRAILLGAIAVMSIAAIALAMTLSRTAPVPEGPPVLAVAPFLLPDGSDGTTGGMTATITADLVAVLGTSPDLQAVVPLGSAAEADGSAPDYVLETQLVHGSPYDAFAIRLLDGPGGAPVWSGRREFLAGDYAAERRRIGARIYSSLLGAQGEILRLEAERVRSAFGATTPYGAHLAGQVAFMEGTTEGWQRAEQTWRDGLAQHPGSHQLQLDLAFLAYRRAATLPPEAAAREIGAAWLAVNGVGDGTGLSAGERWRYHYLRAVLMPPMLGDFTSAMAEALRAHDLAPWHPMANADLALVMANGGRADLAIDWATYAVETEVNPPDWYREVLAWAHVCDDRLGDALKIYQGLADPVRPEHALTLMLLGREAESRAMFDALAKREGGTVTADQIALGVGGRQPRAVGKGQQNVEFGVWKLNLGQPRKPVQVVDAGDTGRKAKTSTGRKSSAKAAKRLPAVVLEAEPPPVDDVAVAAIGGLDPSAPHPAAIPSMDGKGRTVLRPVTGHRRLSGFALPGNFISLPQGEQRKFNPTVQTPLPPRAQDGGIEPVVPLAPGTF